MSAPGNVRSAVNSRDDWETPVALFDLLNAEFQFTLDGAASAENRKCPRYYSLPDANAFLQAPSGERIFLNPPYGDVLPDWIDLAQDWSYRNLVVLLVPNGSDTRWFKSIADWRGTREIRLLTPRVQFVGTTSSNPGGSAIGVMGPGERPTHMWSWGWKE